MKQNTKTILLLLTIGLLLVASRFVSPMNNFSPLAAIALFGATFFAKRWIGVALALGATIFSDFLLSLQNPSFGTFYEGFYWQYLGYIAIAIIGLGLLKKVNLPTVFGGALLGAIAFFLISNFGVWIGSGMYSLDLAGLTKCYTMAVPFFRGTISSMLIYSGVFYFIHQYFLQTNVTTAKA